MATNKKKKETKSPNTKNMDLISRKVNTLTRDFECIQLDIKSMARSIIALEEKSKHEDISGVSDLLNRIKSRLGL